MRALVTGVTRGLGRLLVDHLVADGWEVVAVARRGDALAELATTWGPAVTAYVADVTDAPRMAAVAAEAGELDLVVVNAGALQATGAFWEADLDEWLAGVEVNLHGAAATLHGVLPGMVARGSGRVVVLGSGIGHRPSPWVTQYSVSKAAVARLVESLQVELDGTGVRCFLVSPGMVRTDMTAWPDSLVERLPHLGALDDDDWTPPEAFCRLVDRIAAGEVDAAAGHFLHATDDPERVVAAVEADPTVRTLRQVAAYDGDPSA